MMQPCAIGNMTVVEACLRWDEQQVGADVADDI